MKKHEARLIEGGFADVYIASEVDEVLKRQAAAAITGMHAATAISSGQVEQARRLRAESSPEALESERRANAILTERIADLERALHQIKNGCVDDDDVVNELFRSSPAEIRKIATAALAGHCP